VIVLVRHASTDWSGVRYCGLADPPLSDVGRREAKEAADRVAALVEPGVRIVSSPRQRALDTARVIARATGAKGSAIDERWQEVDVGEAEGLTFVELEARWPDLALLLATGATDITWPGGEPAGALTTRIREAWSELDDAEGTTVVVTHGGPIGVALDLAIGRGEARPFLDPGGVVVLQRGAAGWGIERGA
jgi:probable phosphoglycerate mutase